MKYNSICLLGGTGFVGQHLANRLSRLGYRVTVLTRRCERHRSLKVNRNVQLVEANVFDCNALQPHFRNADAVINLVGILNEGRAADLRFASVHAEFPATVANTAVSTGVSRLLHMSALNADAGEADSVYLRTKGAGEDSAHAAAAKGLAVTSFRPSVIFGPGDSFFNRFATLLRLVPEVFPLACPDARFAPVYVDDVARAFVNAIDNRATFGQRYDLCGPQSFTLRELVDYTDRQINGDHWIIGLGAGLSKLQARMLEFVPGKPMSLDNYRSLQVDSVCAGPIAAELGVTPTAIDSVVPLYLGQQGHAARLDVYRKMAHHR